MGAAREQKQDTKVSVVSISIERPDELHAALA